jgi:hypothetical protein
MADFQLPWSKQEIIDAMVAENCPYNFDDPNTWLFFCQVRALMCLARSGRGPLGFGTELAERLKDGRGPSELEQAVYARLGRVLHALRNGRDPNAAYEIPLPGEVH